MRRTSLLQLIIVFLFVQLFFGKAIAADRTHEIGVQAYIYAYPMIMMEVTRRVSTNVEAPIGPRAPMNQFAHLRSFPDHTFKEVVRPNADTLYSIVWFDVSKEPQVLSISDTGGRYYMLPMLDMWTDVIAAPCSRTSGTKAANFAIVGPMWKGSLPNGIEPVRSPTNVGWIIGRTQTNGAADYENVHRIQDGYKLTPLSQWGKSYMPPVKVPVNSTWDMKTPPPVQVAKMSAKAYFELFAKLLKDNPPHELDWNMVEQLKQIGIVPGEEFDFSKLSAETQKTLERAVGGAQKMIAEKQTGEAINGWQIARELMGNYGTSYLQRAYIALIGLGANVPEDAVYPMSNVDNEGQPYNGSYRYVIHFEKGELPPVRGFWSLSMYGEEMYFVDNPIRRYAIGDRDKLQYNKDGSLDIYIQHASPGKDKESNWLPAPEDDFDLVLRAYWPVLEVLTGGWNPPAVKRVRDAVLSAADAKAIAKEAYIYGFPMVMGYKTIYNYAVDKENPDYKGPFNKLSCVARLFTPEDKAIVTPNADTPYCMFWMDLRAEPLVLTVPEMDPERFYQFQLIDLYTHNFAYVGTLTSGNGGGKFLLAGPDWAGEKPEGVTDVIRSETGFIFNITRTQLFGPDDLPKVKEIQGIYDLQSLSAFLGKAAPAAAPTPDFPVWVEGSQFDERMFSYLDFMLSLLEKPLEEEKPLWDRFARLGLGPQNAFDFSVLPAQTQDAMKAGIKEGFGDMEQLIAKARSDPLASAKLFGTREFLQKSAKENYGHENHYLMRAAAGHIGLFGNSAAEAIYPAYLANSDGRPYDASANKYTIRFEKGKLPPVKAFWSLTMYDGKTQLFIENPLDRYLLNSAMMDQFKMQDDGSLVLHIGKDSPGGDLESNWLPAPDGPFYMVLRLYGPEPKALEGKWTPPVLQKVD